MAVTIAIMYAYYMHQKELNVTFSLNLVASAASFVVFCIVRNIIKSFRIQSAVCLPA